MISDDIGNTFQWFVGGGNQQINVKLMIYSHKILT